MHRILVVKLMSMGDAIASTPVIRALRQKYPDSHITLLTSEPYEEIFRDNPNIDALKLSPPMENHWETGYTIFYYDTSIVAEIRNASYDKVIELNTLNMWFEYRRTGVDLCDHYAEMADVYPLKDKKYEISVTEEDGSSELKDADSDVWSEVYDRGETPICVHLGGGWGLKVIPFNIWKDAIIEIDDALHNDGDDSPIFFIGGPSDNPPDYMLKDLRLLHRPCIDTTHTISGIRTKYHLLRHSKLFIGGDSGPMHLASAANCPTVALYCVTSQFVGTPNCDRFITIQSPGSCPAPCGLVQCVTHQLCSKLFTPSHISKAAIDILRDKEDRKIHLVGDKPSHHYFHAWEHLSLDHDRPDLAEWLPQRAMIQDDWELNK
jgi:ADP-heptose:LPS heptosyltransferase